MGTRGRAYISQFENSVGILCVPARQGVRGGPGLRKHRKQGHPPSPRPRNDSISQQSGLSAVVVYRAGCAIAINLER